MISAGNIIIRPNPRRPDEPQLVLLDHGLYVHVTDTFKRQYATLWKALLATDYSAIERVTKEWGIGTPDLFASATLLRPVHFKNGNENENEKQGDVVEESDQYEQSMRMKTRLKAFLTDTDKWPKELIFVGRNMRFVGFQLP